MSTGQLFNSRTITFGTLTADDLEAMMRAQDIREGEKPPWTNQTRKSSTMSQASSSSSLRNKGSMRPDRATDSIRTGPGPTPPSSSSPFSLPSNMRNVLVKREEPARHPFVPIGGVLPPSSSTQPLPGEPTPTPPAPAAPAPAPAPLSAPSLGEEASTILSRRARTRNEPMAKDLPRSVLLPLDAKLHIVRAPHHHSNSQSSPLTSHTKNESSLRLGSVSKESKSKAPIQTDAPQKASAPQKAQIKSPPLSPPPIKKERASTPPAPAPTPPPLAAAGQPSRSAMKQGSSASTKSWADLIRGTEPSGKRVSILGPGETDPTTPTLSHQSKELGKADVAHEHVNHRPLRSSMKKHTPANEFYRAPMIHSRGLVNHGNMCFANVILQVLIHCPPFYNFLTLVAEKQDSAVASGGGAADLDRVAPLLAALTKFLKEFKIVDDEPESGPPVGQANEPWKSHLVADSVYQALRGNKRFDLMRKGRQEDAEEFLGFVLEVLHDELGALVSGDKGFRTEMEKLNAKLGNVEMNEGNDVSKEVKANGHGPGHAAEGSLQTADESIGWMEVGPKQKTSRLRSTTTNDTAITRIFGGKLRSILQVAGSKGSVTLEPFWPLQLDIEREQVTSIENALVNLTVPDTLTDLWSTSRHAKVEGSKQVFIDTLPPVLLVHLKRFLFDEVGGTQKSHKLISYDTELTIPNEAIAPLRRTSQPVKYHLFAVVYHHGTLASGGHYTTDLCRADMTSWINIDDVTIRPIKATSVALDRGKELMRLSLPSNLGRGGVPEKVAYLLAYVRAENDGRRELK